mmetsp:Transcript_31206/g.54219  ORF Transcript_31206/g.54219 Transcript_31206/m.54219 type:complete len:93 (-) Transcript_31206:247-525(-)
MPAEASALLSEHVKQLEAEAEEQVEQFEWQDVHETESPAMESKNDALHEHDPPTTSAFASTQVRQLDAETEEQVLQFEWHEAQATASPLIES